MKWKDEDIENYILNRLSVDEQAAFARDLLQHEDLKLRLDQIHTMITGVQVGFNRELKQELQQHERQLKVAEKPRRILFASKWPLLVAASVALLVVAVVVIVELRPPAPASLYAAYYEPYPNVVQPLTRSSEASQQALALYEAGRYAEAAESLESLHAAGLLPETVTDFYLGMCYLELNESGLAIERFTEVIQSGASSFTRPAQWYRALAWLSVDNADEAAKGLESLAAGDDVYARKASALLEDL
jgi:hypothetical protein